MPRFFMPVVAGRPSYDTVAAAIGVTWSDANTLSISVADPASAELFAYSSGFVRLVPPGAESEWEAGPFASAATLELQVWALDYARLRHQPDSGEPCLPAGVPPPASVLYFNVDVPSVRAAMAGQIAALSDEVLLSHWDAETPGSRAEWENHYAEQFVAGAVSIFVDAGTSLGSAASRTLGWRLIDVQANAIYPVLHLRGMPQYAGEEWEDHPLITALEDVPAPFDAYLRFEFWDGTKWAALPHNVSVDLVDDQQPTGDDIILDTRTTDEGGGVHFRIDDLRQLSDSQPDIYFVVHSGGIENPVGPMPERWSSRGWSALDDSPGYYRDFYGSQLGFPEDPLVFRIGFLLHVQFQYVWYSSGWENRESPQPASGLEATVWFPAPLKSRVRVSFTHDEFGTLVQQVLETNDTGAVQAAWLNLVGGCELLLEILNEVEDPSISLARTTIDAQWPQISLAGTLWQKRYGNVGFSSLPSAEQPAVLRIQDFDASYALRLLKHVRELSFLLHHLTVGSEPPWSGVELEVNIGTLGGARAWPVGIGTFPRGDDQMQTKRNTIMHELSHQVMWKMLGISTWNLLVTFTREHLFFPHIVKVISHPVHALIEGWAAFVGAIFAEQFVQDRAPGTTEPLEFPHDRQLLEYSEDFQDTVGLFRPLIGEQNATVEGPHLFDEVNLGERVEGAFASALWTILRNRVAPRDATFSALTNLYLINESQAGDFTLSDSWLLDPGANLRFRSMIWDPLCKLVTLPDSDGEPYDLSGNAPVPWGTTDMVRLMRDLNPDVWHLLLADLQRYNLARDYLPSIKSTDYRGDPAVLTVNGENFAEGAVVRVGGVEVEYELVSSSLLLAHPTPAFFPSGALDVEVKTLAGTAVRPGGFTP